MPLGSIDGDIIALEAVCQRYGKGEFGGEVYWAYEVSLKRFRADYSDTLMTPLSVRKAVKYDNVASYLDSLTSVAFRWCRDIVGFKPFTGYELGICDMVGGCTDVKLVSCDTSTCLAIGEGTSHIPIAFFQPTYSGNLAQSYLNFRAPYPLDTTGIDLKALSIRKYSNSSIELLVVHLATGHVLQPAVGKIEAAPGPQPPQYEKRSMRNGAYAEPVLHHGKGFDFYVFR